MGNEGQKTCNEVSFLPAGQHKSFLQVDSITLGVQSQAYPKYPNNTFAISFQYLKLIFKLISFFKLIVSFLVCVCVARHTPITQNIKFPISLQYLTKEVNDEVDFLHAEEHEDFVQINTMVLIGMVKRP